MTYSELVNLVEKDKHLKTRMDVIAYLIGYQGKIDANDFDNIIDLYTNGFIKA